MKITIEKITNMIIKEIKSFPNEAKQSQSQSGPKTSWDEYKEQVQYEEYDSFEVFQERLFQLFKRIWVSEELGHPDEKILEEELGLSGVFLEVTHVVVDIFNTMQIHSLLNPPAQGRLLPGFQR